VVAKDIGEGDIRVESRKAEADCRDNESRGF